MSAFRSAAMAALLLASMGASAFAEETGRFQVVTEQLVLGQRLWLVDTATGQTWRLASAPVPMGDGSIGSQERWFPVDRSERPLPPEPPRPVSDKKGAVAR